MFDASTEGSPGPAGIDGWAEESFGICSLRMDLALYLVVLVLFASFFTCHLWLCAAMARKNFLQALLALLVFPLAPYFGLAMGFRRLPTAWIASGSLYAFCLLLALLLPETY